MLNSNGKTQIILLKFDKMIHQDRMLFNLEDMPTGVQCAPGFLIYMLYPMLIWSFMVTTVFESFVVQ